MIIVGTLSLLTILLGCGSFSAGILFGEKREERRQFGPVKYCRIIGPHDKCVPQ